MKRLPATLVAVLLATPLLARAHEPTVLEADAPLKVENPKISRALYSTFETGRELFVIKLELDEDFAMPIEVFVPHRDSLAAHRPAWALVGAGMPEPSAEERAALPSALPEGAGAWVDLNRIAPRPVFYESFTRRFFWSSGTTAVIIPAGSYELWVWSPQGTKGKFGVGFGVEEGGNYLRAFSDWSTYAY